MNEEIRFPDVALRGVAQEPDHLHFDRHAGVWRTHEELAARASGARRPVAVAADPVQGGRE